MKLILCCQSASNVKPYLKKYWFNGENGAGYTYDTSFCENEGYDSEQNLNGKALIQCDYDIEEIKTIVLDNYSEDDTYKNISYTTKTLNASQLRQRCCKYYDDMVNCLNDNNGYAIHLKNIEILDEPKELSDFTVRSHRDYDTMTCDSCTNTNIKCENCPNYYHYNNIVKMPKNLIKVCEWDLNDNILLSRNPKEMLQIISGEQTTIILKRILKEMKVN